MSGLSAEILANEAKYNRAKYWEGPNGPTAAETKAKDDWMMSAGHAAAWFEGMKSDLTNPFQTRNQIEILQKNHDNIESQMRQGIKTEYVQRNHDFMAECIGLLSGWKASQDQVAAKKPAPEEAKASAEKWAQGLFKGFVPVTEGKSVAQLMREVETGNVMLPTQIGSYWQMAMSDANESLKSAQARASNDPSTSWDIEYWTNYKREVAKFKDFIDAQQSRTYSDKISKGPTPEEQAVIATYPAIDERQHNDTSDPNYHIDLGPSNVVYPNHDGGTAEGKVIETPKSESTYLWIGIGVAAAGVLLMAVFM